MARFDLTGNDGESAVVVADTVTFEPTGHVVFRDRELRVVWAVNGDYVDGIKQSGAVGSVTTKKKG